MKKTLIAVAMTASILALQGCSPAPSSDTGSQQGVSVESPKEDNQNNPLFKASPLIYEAPVFDKIDNAHFLPAFEEGMKQHSEEIEEIAKNPQPASFDNTLVAMEKSGALLTRTSRIFFNLAGTDSSAERRELQKTLAPRLAAHRDSISLNHQLFSRIETLYNRRDELKLDAESLRLLEETYGSFVHAGAKLNEVEKNKICLLYTSPSPRD